MLNQIIIMGRLTRDPELRQTPSGVPVASFTLAVDRPFKNKETGERPTDFIDVVAWRHSAEFVSRYFSKGRTAVVQGRLQLEDWTDKDGGKRRSAKVQAENIYFGDSKKDGDNGGGNWNAGNSGGNFGNTSGGNYGSGGGNYSAPSSGGGYSGGGNYGSPSTGGYSNGGDYSAPSGGGYSGGGDYSAPSTGGYSGGGNYGSPSTGGYSGGGNYGAPSEGYDSGSSSSNNEQFAALTSDDESNLPF